MGQITMWATDYAEGRIDLDRLIQNLRGFDFQTPARFESMPKDLFEAEAQAEERTYDDEDTMDEVYMAKARGLLSRDDLLAVATALERGLPGD